MGNHEGIPLAYPDTSFMNIPSRILEEKTNLLNFFLKNSFEPYFMRIKLGIVHKLR